MITELIRDNRKIIDRIPREEVDRIVGLVKRYKVSPVHSSGLSAYKMSTFSLSSLSLSHHLIVNKLFTKPTFSIAELQIFRSTWSSMRL